MFFSPSREMSMMRVIHTGILLLLCGGMVQAQVVRQDMTQLLTWKNLGYATIGLGTAGAVHPWDDDVKGKLEGVFPVEGSADVTNVIGASNFNLPVSAGMWVLGKAARQPKLEQLGSNLLRTLVYTQVVVAPVKVAVRRERPDGSNRLSFPSGHTANSCALARMLERQYGHRVGIPLYVFSAFVAAGRIEDDRHYVSDVVMGAFLGAIVGNSVTLGSDGRTGVVPRLTRDGVLLTLCMSVDL